MARAGKDRTALHAERDIPHSRFTAWIKDGKLPGGEYLQVLSEALDVNAHWLLTGEGPIERPSNGEASGYRAAVVERAFLEIARIVDEVRGMPAPEVEAGTRETTRGEVEDAAQIVADLDNMDNRRRVAGE